MARRGLRSGTCHLCGSEAGLSYEHVPPRSAFNKGDFLSPDFEEVVASNDLSFMDNPTGQIIQGGAGSYTLCIECNRFTGRHYGNSFKEFAEACADYSFTDLKANKIGVVLKIRPLRVIKQILSMFCSACGPGFAPAHPDLPRYILNPESRAYPAGIKIYMALYHTSLSLLTRQSGVTASMDIASGKTFVMSEICFPPFVLYADLAGNFDDRRFLNIDWFNGFDYAESCERFMILNLLPVNSIFPYDYRTKEEIQADFATNHSEAL